MCPLSSVPAWEKGGTLEQIPKKEVHDKHQMNLLEFYIHLVHFSVRMGSSISARRRGRESLLLQAAGSLDKPDRRPYHRGDTSTRGHNWTQTLRLARREEAFPVSRTPPSCQTYNGGVTVTFSPVQVITVARGGAAGLCVLGLSFHQI